MQYTLLIYSDLSDSVITLPIYFSKHSTEQVYISRLYIARLTPTPFALLYICILALSGIYRPFLLHLPILCNKLSAVLISVYNTSKSISRLASTNCVVTHIPVSFSLSENFIISFSSILLCSLVNRACRR